MNWDRISGEWKNLKGKAREKWGKLTDSDWEQVGGKKDQLIGKLQAHYGWSKEQASREVDDWAREHERQPMGTSGSQPQTGRTDRDRERKAG